MTHVFYCDINYQSSKSFSYSVLLELGETIVTEVTPRMGETTENGGTVSTRETPMTGDMTGGSTG